MRKPSGQRRCRWCDRRRQRRKRRQPPNGRSADTGLPRWARLCHAIACMRILAVDVGGSHVKALATGQAEPRRIVSGREMSAAAMVVGVKAMTADWPYDVVSLGYPGQVVHNLPAHEPANLGVGWTGFDYAAAFGCP